MIFPPTPVARAVRLMHTAQADELFEVAATRARQPVRPAPRRPSGNVIPLAEDTRPG